MSIFVSWGDLILGFLVGVVVSAGFIVGVLLWDDRMRNRSKGRS